MGFADHIREHRAERVKLFQEQQRRSTPSPRRDPMAEPPGQARRKARGMAMTSPQPEVMAIIEQLQAKIQMLEASHDAQREASTPQILAMGPNGQLLEANDAIMERRVAEMRVPVMAEIASFRRELDTGRWVEVENWTDIEFKGMVNGVRYVVPDRNQRPLNVKKLPLKLALHYATKSQMSEAIAKFQKYTGAMDADDVVQDIPMHINDFAREVSAYETTIGNNVDSELYNRVY